MSTRKVVLVAVGLLVIFESILTAALWARLTRTSGQPPDLVAGYFPLTRLLVRPWVKPRAALAPYLGGHQRYLGNLSPNDASWGQVMRPDTILGWRSEPSITVTHLGRYIYATNDQGFYSIGERDAHYAATPAPGVVRVIVIGGSTVMGQGAPTPKENLPAAIGRTLQRVMPDQRFEVINAAGPGYASGQEWLYLETELLAYHPSLVIVYDGWNDEAYSNLQFTERHSEIPDLKTDTHLVADVRLTDSLSLLGSAHLFLRALRGQIRDAAHATAIFYTWTTLMNRLRHPATEQSVATYHHESVERYLLNWHRMTDTARRGHIPIALMLQPLLGVDQKPISSEERSNLPNEADGAVRQAFYADARAAIRAMPTGRDVCVGDLSQVFGEKAETVYADSGHLTAHGNALVAAALVDRLASCGLLAP